MFPSSGFYKEQDVPSLSITTNILQRTKIGRVVKKVGRQLFGEPSVHFNRTKCHLTHFVAWKVGRGLVMRCAVQ